jgi:putative addiction module component (TIGR02574 family)
VTAFEKLQKDVLALSLQQRAVLAESLLKSLPPPDSLSVDSDELEEEQRRNDEIESGAAKPISKAELFEHVRSKRRG